MKKNVISLSLSDCILQRFEETGVSLQGATLYRLDLSFIERRPSLTHFLEYYSFDLSALQELADVSDFLYSNYYVPQRVRYKMYELSHLYVQYVCELSKLSSSDIKFDENLIKDWFSGVLFDLQIEKEG